MTLLRLSTLVFLVPLAEHYVLATAQTSPGASSTVQCSPTTQWEFNSAGDSPCLVWGQLLNLCVTNGIDVTPLTNPTGYHYTPPTTNGSFEADDCNCNVVSYNLMAACSWCQPGAQRTSWLNESDYSVGCPSYDQSGVTGVSIAALTIPAWAFIQQHGNSWNPDVAYANYTGTLAVASASSASVASLSSTGTTSTGSSTTQSFASASGSSSPDNGGGGSSSSSNIGAIVGGVVGGVVGLALIVVLLWYVIYRHRQSTRAAAAAGTAATGSVYSSAAPGAPGGTAQWGAYDKEGTASVSSPSTSPFPQGVTPLPYSYGSTPTPGVGGMGYEGVPPPMGGMSPPPQMGQVQMGGMAQGGMGMYAQPAFGEGYGSPPRGGVYTGLPEA